MILKFSFSIYSMTNNTVLEKWELFLIKATSTFMLIGEVNDALQRKEISIKRTNNTDFQYTRKICQFICMINSYRIKQFCIINVNI